MGRQCAAFFADEAPTSWYPTATSRAATDVTAEITSTGGSAVVNVCDVRELDQIKAMLSDVEKDHGVLHILFNHAGIPGGGGMDIELDDYTRTVEVNMRSAFYATTYALPLLRKAPGNASIIFTASVSGLVGSTSFSPLYSMTKGGIVLLMITRRPPRPGRESDRTRSCRR